MDVLHRGRDIFVTENLLHVFTSSPIVMLLANVATAAQPAPNTCSLSARLAVAAALKTYEMVGDEHDDLFVTTADLENYVISKTIDRGNCDPGSLDAKQTWCQHAGGDPEIYEIEISEQRSYGVYAVGSAILATNRGACRAARVSVKF